MPAASEAEPSSLDTGYVRTPVPKTFPRFSSLPKELQIMIFEHSAAEPQSICLQSGISSSALLSTCYLSRTILQKRFVTHQGSAWERFKVIFNQDIDYMDITALFRPEILHKSWIMAPAMNQTLLYRGPWTTDLQLFVERNLRSMAWFNTRCCSVLAHLNRTDPGRRFMGSLRKLRMDVKAMDHLAEAFRHSFHTEKDDWCDLWEWILDNFHDVKEIEMRFVDRKTVADILSERELAAKREPRVEEVGVWKWNGETISYERIDSGRRKEVFDVSSDEEEFVDMSMLSGETDEELNDAWSGFSSGEQLTTKALLRGAKDGEELIRAVDLDGDDVNDDGTIWTLPMPRIVVTRVIE
ncbi:hypothetical protein ONS96_011512 [Cadophora gregata f. sp. sojae]|nr:hypothetical protein ONS96_011512 [Cadophora gregata f. sp. sojae]